MLTAMSSNDAVTVRFAAKSLTYFCLHDTYSEEVMRLNGLPVILQGVTSRDTETVRESLTCVSHLLRYEETVQLIKKMNYVTRIVRLFLQHVSSSAEAVQFVKAQLLAIVAELSNEVDVRPEMVRLGLIKVLIDLLSSREVCVPPPPCSPTVLSVPWVSDWRLCDGAPSRSNPRSTPPCAWPIFAPSSRPRLSSSRTPASSSWWPRYVPTCPTNWAVR